MGRRPGDPEGAGTRLAQDNMGDFAEFAANLLGKRLVCVRMGLLPLMTLAEKSFDPGRSSSDQSCGAAIEATLFRLVGLRPGRCDVAIEVAFRSAAEAAVDQPQGMADAR